MVVCPWASCAHFVLNSTSIQPIPPTPAKAQELSKLWLELA